MTCPRTHIWQEDYIRYTSNSSSCSNTMRSAAPRQLYGQLHSLPLERAQSWARRSYCRARRKQMKENKKLIFPNDIITSREVNTWSENTFNAKLIFSMYCPTGYTAQEQTEKMLCILGKWDTGITCMIWKLNAKVPAHNPQHGTSSHLPRTKFI